MFQLLLFFSYVAIIGLLISAVLEEPMSGVVIIIIGVPITAIYLAIATLVWLIPRFLRHNVSVITEPSGQESTEIH